MSGVRGFAWNRKPSEDDTVKERIPATELLSASLYEQDHAWLEAVLDNAEWVISTASSIVATIALLRFGRAAVVICDEELGWKDVLQAILAQDSPPYLIVSSRTGDEHLWAEALNLGAYDVLIKPFQVAEVCRVIESASRRWHDRRRTHVPVPQVRSAAG